MQFKRISVITASPSLAKTFSRAAVDKYPQSNAMRMTGFQLRFMPAGESFALFPSVAPYNSTPILEYL
jgi:hypothetical protein